MKYPLIAIVLIALLATGEAIKCYDCTSSLDPKCSDPFDESAEVKENNSTASDVCMKEVRVFTNKTYTNRHCSPPGVSSKSSRSLDPNTTIMVSYAVYVCNTDLCNGASSMATALSTLMTLAMLSVFVNGN